MPQVGKAGECAQIMRSPKLQQLTAFTRRGCWRSPPTPSSVKRIGLLKKLNVPVVEKLPLNALLPVNVLFPPTKANDPAPNPFSRAALTLLTPLPLPLNVAPEIEPVALMFPVTLWLP